MTERSGAPSTPAAGTSRFGRSPDASRKGALVDLRPGPHEVVSLRRGAQLTPMRSRDGRLNAERAFGDVGNFVSAPDGREIAGNRGSAWPSSWSQEVSW